MPIILADFVHIELQIIAYQGICAYRIDNLDALIWENVFALRKILFENPTDAQMCGRAVLRNLGSCKRG